MTDNEFLEDNDLEIEEDIINHDNATDFYDTNDLWREYGS